VSLRSNRDRRPRGRPVLFRLALLAGLLVAGAAPAQPAAGPWEPFPTDPADLLLRATSLLPVSDGGWAAPQLLLAEPGASPVADLRVDGVPLQAGHRWTDDPWRVGLAGLAAPAAEPGGGVFLDGIPRLAWRSLPPDSAGAVVATAFAKGEHGEYLRRIDYRTPAAPWAIRFGFDERMDQDGYAYPGGDGTPFAPRRDGEARWRRAHTAVTRADSLGRRLQVTYDRARGLRHGLAASGTGMARWWQQRTVVRAVDPGRSLRGAVYDVNDDAVRDARHLEVDRRGAVLAWTGDGPVRRVDARFDAWRLTDDGAGVDWLPAGMSAAARGATQAAGVAAHLAPVRRVTLVAALRWHDRAGWSPAAGARGELPWRGTRWSLWRGGRAPRLDELWTADRAGVGDAAWLLLPAADLDWEQTWRGELSWSGRWRGWRLAAVVAGRRVRHGIGWRALPGETRTGSWANDLDLDGWRATWSIARRLRLAGRAEIRWRGSLADATVHHGVPLALPPRSEQRLGFRWQHAWFQGDGVLEVAYDLVRRGAMDDPWLPAGAVRLPAFTRHDLYLGFRLVGADLSVSLRNLTGERYPLSARTWSDGLVRRWRLRWTFRR